MKKQAEQREAAKHFADVWKDKEGSEKGQTQQFWASLLHDVFGVEKFEDFIQFEVKVQLDHISFIDAYIPSTKVLIEQKSKGINLSDSFKQSDGSFLTPFMQAKRYSNELPYSNKPRWIVVSDFQEFHVHDMNKPNQSPEIIKLEELRNEYYRLSFLVDETNENIRKQEVVSLQAGELVGKLYEALRKEYKAPENEKTLGDLNMLCVRLVFCFYAEDAGLFGRRNMFHDYLAKVDPKKFRAALISVFQVLNQAQNGRDPYLEEDLAAFPYVNGGLFDQEDVVIPTISEETIDIILNQASARFDWSKISPTIFGSVFENTLNPETRRTGGMHYTSVENIHKVIDPLFMNELNEEFNKIKEKHRPGKVGNKKLDEFQNKLASLKFLDPAAGSGNFLTETYISLRHLENQILKLKYGSQIVSGDITNSIKVSINQFNGIEVNDFAVAVAKTALWIAESQMIQETQSIVKISEDFLPIRSSANIIEDNALTMDWEKVVPKEKLNYIMGNPPFLGYSQQSDQQKEDLKKVFVDKNGNPFKNAGKIDYVSAWYVKAAKMIRDTDIQVAFVSTNSITQGEQVPSIWKPLIEEYKIELSFAYRTFRWDSEANDKAHVHVVIIGFCYDSKDQNKPKYIFDNNIGSQVSRINAYLSDAPAIFIESRKKPISSVPEMTTGNRPADGGHLIIEASDYENFVNKEPNAKPYIKKLVGSEEYINNKLRYCLWLVGVPPDTLRMMPEVMKRIEACKKDRLNGAPDRQKLAATPWLFRETMNPQEYILVPLTSSEKRKYIPMGFLDHETIPTNSAGIIPNGSKYNFGVLISNVHMAWMRTVAGRLKSDYRYSKDIVYNNFPWPTPDETQKNRIEETAQAILSARQSYPNASLADLYDDLTMPPELRKAHQENDKAVMESYGFNQRKMTESELVAELMKRYQEITLKTPYGR